MIKLIFWNVQHGHATYLQTPKCNFAFDLGVGSAAERDFSPLLHLKNNYNIKSLDAVIITHPHSDHLYDIVNFDSVAPRVLHRPGHLTEQEIRATNRDTDKIYIDKYLEINARYNSPVQANNNPFDPVNNGNVSFEFFGSSNCSRSNINNHSVVTVITHASLKVIIPGDNETESWNELLKDARFLKAIEGTAVLLAPHHGRLSGYSEELFKKIAPYLTVISDGSETDTSATPNYSNKTKGWTVRKRDGSSLERKCITTRNDGVITIEIGMGDNQTPYLAATIV